MLILFFINQSIAELHAAKHIEIGKVNHANFAPNTVAPSVSRLRYLICRHSLDGVAQEIYINCIEGLNIFFIPLRISDKTLLQIHSQD